MKEALVVTVNWLLNGHAGLTPFDYAMNALFAFLGASVTVFALNPRIKLPKRTSAGFEPGVVGIYVIGLSCALAVGYRVPVPFMVGMLSPVTAPALLKGALPAVLKIISPALVTVLEGTAAKLKGKGGDGQ